MATLRLLSLISSLALSLWCSTAAFARDLDPDTVATLKQRFAAADTNKDGKLTREECSAGMPRIYRGFDEIDSGKKGFITLDQIMAFVAAH